MNAKPSRQGAEAPDDMPEIAVEKVCFVAEKARELLEEEGGALSGLEEADSGDGARVSSHAAIRAELTQFIEDLDVDESAALVALAWIGRGDYAAEDWRSAVAQAIERREGPTSRYLLSMELLPDYLEDALSDFGQSCEGAEE